LAIGYKNGFGQEAQEWIWSGSARCVFVATKQTRFTPDGRKVKKKLRKLFQNESRVRPISILPYAYLPEYYKIETGSMRR